jgi:hypothetical protein
MDVGGAPFGCVVSVFPAPVAALQQERVDGG